ncbi:MAG: beta strand repeat-containing protein, partial [Flavobacteriales bacterium]
WFRVYEYCAPNRNYQTATATGNPNSQNTAAGAALSANTLTPFGSNCIGGTYGPNSFTLTGANLTNADITVSSPSSVYQLSTSSTGPYSSSLTLSQSGGAYTQDIYVQYSPVAAVTSSGNIAISGGGSSSINVAVSGTGIAAAAPSVVTPASSLITFNSATLGASVASINCSDVTIRGVEWSTTNGFVNGTGTIISEAGTFGVGDFSFSVSGLIPNQVLYWKAFVTNASGTTYTAQQTFTTAQQYLSVGDLSILGFNTTNPDEFVFVNWAPITRNMVIKFTDNGFNAASLATAANNARGGENFVIWKNNTGSDIDPGTVIRINGSTTTSGQIVSGGLTGITTTDQIFAYQGAALTGANPDWISNLNPTTYTGNIVYGLNIGSTGFITTGTAASTSSYLPTELAVANGSIAITGTVAGSQYTATRSALGSIIAYRSLVNNPANWTTATSGTITLNLTAFTVNPNVATQIAVTSVNAGVNPSVNTPFAVSFETRDANGAAASVGIDTDFAITLGAGTGAVGGTLAGTITAGSGTLTISGVTYSTAETGVTLTVGSTTGQSLTAGTSASFTIDSAATNLAFVSLETFLYTGNAAPTFTVQARRN